MDAVKSMESGASSFVNLFPINEDTNDKGDETLELGIFDRESSELNLNNFEDLYAFVVDEPDSLLAIKLYKEKLIPLLENLENGRKDRAKINIYLNLVGCFIETHQFSEALNWLTKISESDLTLDQKLRFHSKRMTASSRVSNDTLFDESKEFLLNSLCSRNQFPSDKVSEVFTSLLIHSDFVIKDLEEYYEIIDRARELGIKGIDFLYIKVECVKKFDKKSDDYEELKGIIEASVNTPQYNAINLKPFQRSELLLSIDRSDGIKEEDTNQLFDVSEQYKKFPELQFHAAETWIKGFLIELKSTGDNIEDLEVKKDKFLEYWRVIEKSLGKNVFNTFLEQNPVEILANSVSSSVSNDGVKLNYNDVPDFIIDILSIIKILFQDNKNLKSDDDCLQMALSEYSKNHYRSNYLKLKNIIISENFSDLSGFILDNYPVDSVLISNDFSEENSVSSDIEISEDSAIYQVIRIPFASKLLEIRSLAPLGMLPEDISLLSIALSSKEIDLSTKKPLFNDSPSIKALLSRTIDKYISKDDLMDEDLRTLHELYYMESGFPIIMNPTDYITVKSVDHLSAGCGLKPLENDCTTFILGKMSKEVSDSFIAPYRGEYDNFMEIGALASDGLLGFSPISSIYSTLRDEMVSREGKTLLMLGTNQPSMIKILPRYDAKIIEEYQISDASLTIEEQEQSLIDTHTVDIGIASNIVKKTSGDATIALFTFDL